MGTGTTVVFLVVVGARFLVPLVIPRLPLPAILAALLLASRRQSPADRRRQVRRYGAGGGHAESAAGDLEGTADR